MINDTMEKFGYPENLVKNYNNWCLCLRMEQVTLGSLVLICKEAAEKFSDISSESFSEFGSIINDLEVNLKKAFSYNKINYFMLMMIDPHVHFHVIPRYNEQKLFKDIIFNDEGWPGLPVLTNHHELKNNEIRDLRNYLINNFNFE